MPGAIASRVGETLRFAVQLRALEAQVRRAEAIRQPGETGGSAFIRSLGIVADVSESDLKRIPRAGPLLCVANHPLGIIDASTVCEVLSRARTDVRVLANRALERCSLATGQCFFVDLEPGNAATNAAPLRAALEWLRGGGALAVFPAGEVSALRGFPPRIEDGPWNPIIARLQRKTSSTVLPLWVGGANSTLFQLSGLVHPFLRTMQIPSEALRRSSTRVPVGIGTSISPAQCAAIAGDHDLLAAWRGRVELLRTERRGARTTKARVLAPIPPTTDRWRAELASQAPVLVEQGRWRIHAARGRDIPESMHEVGRLRELSFRAIGEGSGNAIDVDRFDADYTQLILVDTSTDEICGGYRLGPSRELLALGTQDGSGSLAGPDRFYTRECYNYTQTFLDELGDCIELGRSWVRVERQREVLPLHMLWRGIGEYLRTHPEYTTLFGPVSISDEYATASKLLLQRFLEVNRRESRLAPLVRPRHPPATRAGPAWRHRRDWATEWIDRVLPTARTVEELDRLVESVEESGRRMPPLVRHYLRLNARFLAVSVDPDFGNSLDALMVVDIADVDLRIRERYLGGSA